MRAVVEGTEISQVQLDMRKKLSDADMTLDKALERRLHIEAVTIIEEEKKEPRVSAVQSNVKSQLINSIKELLRTLKTGERNRQGNRNS